MRDVWITSFASVFGGSLEDYFEEQDLMMRWMSEWASAACPGVEAFRSDAPITGCAVSIVSFSMDDRRPDS